MPGFLLALVRLTVTYMYGKHLPQQICFMVSCGYFYISISFNS